MPDRRPWARIAAQPLVQFFLLGFVFTALYAAVAPSSNHEIHVGAGTVRALREEFIHREGRAPTAAEESAEIRRWTDEEMLYREAVSLGLDRSDAILRRRLVQKMQFLTEGMTPVPAPSGADLAAYFAAHASEYVLGGTTSFRHVFLANRPGADRAAEAERLRQRLLRSAQDGVASAGEPFLHGSRFDHWSEEQITNLFGRPFAAAVTAAAPGRWIGPLASPYGLHIVYVDAHTPAHPAALAEVRERVAADWRAAKRRALDQQAVVRLREKYAVRIDRGEAKP